MKTQIILAALLLSILWNADAQQTENFADTVKVSIGDSIKMQMVYKNKDVMRNAANIDYNNIMELVNEQINSVEENQTNAEITIKFPLGKVKVNYDSSEKSNTANINTVVTENSNNKSYNISINSNTKKPRKRTTSDGYLDLGLNTYLQDGNTFVSGAQPYDLRPWGSRYVAIGFGYATRIGKEKSPFYIDYGVEFAWNNFMLQDDNRISTANNTLTFEPVADRNFTRNKLVVNYLSIPVVPMIDFSATHKNGFKFGIGGYAGYRINSWTKQTYFEDGNRKRDKVRDDFYLNDFRYGLIAVIGIEDAIDVFVKYDLNNLFEGNRGVPNLNVLSFGVRL